MDVLTGIVWEDGVQIVEAVVRKDYDKKRPRIELTVSPLQQASSGAASGAR